MLKKLSLLTLLLLSTIFVLTGCQKTENTASENQVNQPKVIKAGYISYAPGFIVDPNTKKMSGIFYEVLEEIAKRKNLKIEYAEEVTRATLAESINSNRVQMIASPVRITEDRKKVTDFSNAVYNTPFGAYIKVDNEKIKTPNDINNTGIKIVAIDGEVSVPVAKEKFPNAQLITFPNNVDLSQMLLEVENGRGDVTFLEPTFAFEYIQANTGKLINVAEKEPIKIESNHFMIRKGDVELKNILDEGIAELQKDGTLEKIISKYEKFPGAIGRIK